MKNITRRVILAPVMGINHIKNGIALRCRYIADQADYAIACDDEAAIHYGVDTGSISDIPRRARIFMRGGWQAIFRKIPDHFSLRYECDTTSEMIELRPPKSCKGSLRTPRGW